MTQEIIIINSNQNPQLSTTNSLESFMNTRDLIQRRVDSRH